MTAQELKNSILQLAVQGKLATQNPEDESATDLLKRHKIMPQNNAEIPFDIPDSWCWITIGEVCNLVNGYAFKPTDWSTEGLPIVRIQNLTNKKTPYNYYNGNIEEKYLLHDGDLLFAWSGTLGSFIWDSGIAVLNQHIYRVEHSLALARAYVKYLLDASLNRISDKTHGISMKHITKKELVSLMVPIPPLAEQERIVAKIEELLPLVNEYDKTEKRLTALSAEFPDKLRKSILQQAVQGKLTERDSSDEPATELLKRISAEKARLIADGKIKKEKPLPSITEDDCPFEIPDTWKWVRLGDIVRYQGGYSYKSDTYVKQSDNQIIRLGNVKNNALLLDVSPVYIPDHIAETTEEYRITENTILFTMTGTKGKRDYFYTCRIKEENLSGCKLYLNQRVGCLSAYSNIDLDWLTIVLQSEPILSQIFATATGNANQANIGSANTLKLMVPLPPLAEQQRIVERVEELLAACNRLKPVN